MLNRAADTVFHGAAIQSDSNPVSSRSPTVRLLAGLAITLLAVGVYFAYTIRQLDSLRALQTQTIDRNRTDTLLLLRIQNGLNSLALAMRDMLDNQEPY